MNTYRKLTRIAVYLTVLMVMQGCRNEKKTMPVSQQAEELTAVQRLISKDGEDVSTARDELVASRKTLIGQLIQIIEDKENRVYNTTSVQTAMYILGEMRALEAIDVLVEQLGFPHTAEGGLTVMQGGMMFQRLKDAGRMYPGVNALVKIGEPCLDAVVAKLKSPVIVTPYVAVLVQLRGRDWTVETLTTAMEKETDAEKKRWLKRSLDALAEVPD